MQRKDVFVLVSYRQPKAGAPQFVLLPQASPNPSVLFCTWLSMDHVHNGVYNFAQMDMYSIVLGYAQHYSYLCSHVRNRT